MAMDYQRWNSKWEDLPDPLDEEVDSRAPEAAGLSEAEVCLQAAFARELGQLAPTDKILELKVQMAAEAYEKRRPKAEVMHHYWVKDAGDPEAIGEYLPTGDERSGVPVYRNSRGLVLSREKQPAGLQGGEERHGWVIGDMVERRPLYGVQAEDLSVPTLGWQAFTAPDPLPTIRYYTHASAARLFKDRGNRAFQRRAYEEAERWYTKSLSCRLDPAEYPEVFGMLHSNRAEARLRLDAFDGAAADAEAALRHLEEADSFEEPLQVLKQKTVVRLAKALQGLRRHGAVHRLLEEQCRVYPGNSELERMRGEAELALKAVGRAASVGQRDEPARGASDEMLKYMGRVVEDIQSQVAALGPKVSERVFPSELMTALKKLEYLLAKASSVMGPCLKDLQCALRTCGGLGTLLQVARAQWASNLGGKLVDTFKLPAAAAIAAVVGLACEGSPENCRAASAEAHVLFSILGGCNQKVEAGVCEKLVALASHLWQNCQSRTAEALQAHPVVAERVAAFLSRAALAEAASPAPWPDAPALATVARERAAALLFELLATSRAALRGMIPQLSGPDGDGFFTCEMPAVRSLGEAVVQQVLAEPSLLAAVEVRNALMGVSLLLLSGPCAQAGEGSMTVVPRPEYAREAAALRYLDLGDWPGTEDGQHAALLLQAVAKALQYRLLLNDRELDRDSFRSAFEAGLGYLVTVPLIQAPLPLAEPALRCLSVVAQASPESVPYLVSLSGIDALLGLPSPPSGPQPTHLADVLAKSRDARRDAARLLCRCMQTEAALELVARSGGEAVRAVLRLATQIRKDSLGGAEPFSDMLRVLGAILQYQPGLLCRHIPEETLDVLSHLSASMEPSEEAELARALVPLLSQDPACERRMRPILRRREEGGAYDVEEELRHLQEGPGPWASLAQPVTSA